MDFDLALFNGHLVTAYRFGFGFIVLDVVIDDSSTLIVLLLFIILESSSHYPRVMR